ncbi:unnamed protein product [Closterium sp. NIES-54]
MSATHVTAGGIALSYGYFNFTPDMISVTPLLVGRPDILTWKEAIEPQLEMAGLIGIARGTVATPEEHYPDLRAEFRAMQLLIFTVISRCCSPGVQIALKSCREYLDTGHRAWHFIESTYHVTDALYIVQLEEQLSHIRMGEEETATDYYNRAWRILATMRMAGVHYLTASYLMHDIKGLTSSYNLLKRLSLAPSTRATLNEDSLTSYILQDEAMQEAERPTKLLAHVNYVNPDADKKKSAKDSGHGGGSQRRECWLCGDPNHLSFKCPDHSDSNDDDAKGGRGRSGSRHPCRGKNGSGKEKQSTKSSTLAKDADSSAGGKGRDDKVASCSLVGVVELTDSLAPEAGEDFQAMAAAVQASPVVVLLDSGEEGGRPRPRHCCSARGGREAGAHPRRALCLGRASEPAFGWLAHVGMNTIQSSAKHEVATGLDLKSASGADLQCVSCIRGELARHNFPDQGSDADDVLAVVHVDLSGPFRVAAKDGSLYFLLLKDRKTRNVWVRPVAKKSDALHEFVQWLAVTERQTKNSVLMLCSDRGREFLGKQFTNFVNGKGIVHNLTCPYTPQQNGMAEREMRTVVESVQTMLLHMGVRHHWWHLALRQAVWVRNCLERSTLQPATTPYQLLTGEKPDLSLAWVWGCMAQFLVPELQRGGKLKPKARWGLHLGVSEESKGWELLEITDNRVVTTSDMVFYENMSLGVGEPAAEDVEDVPFPSPSPAPCAPPLVADLRGLTSVSASSDEGRSGTSPSATAKSVAGRIGAADFGEAGEEGTSRAAANRGAGSGETNHEAFRNQAVGRGANHRGEVGREAGQVQQGDEGREAGDDGGDAEESTDSDVVEVQCGLRQSGRIRRPPDFYVPAAFTTPYDEVDDDLQYDDAEEDEDFPELDPDMHADLEHCWEISTMTVKEALASWKGKALKAAMEEEIRILVGMGMWELVERPPGVNTMKNRWVLTMKYHIDDTVERKKARLVVKGFTQVYGADYDETYAPVTSNVTLRIFLGIVTVLDLNLMQLDMKNTFLQSELDWVLYMYQPNYFNDGTGWVCKLLKSLYGLKQSPMLWFRALDGVLLGAGWKKSQGNTALYFNVGSDKVNLLGAGLRRRPARRQQKYSDVEGAEGAARGCLRAAGDLTSAEGYADKLKRRFLDEKKNGRTPKTPVSFDAYAALTFDDEEAQEHVEEEYRQKVGSLQFAATTTRPDIAFACSKLGSGLTVRRDQYWREVDRCLAYLANIRDTPLEFGGGEESLKLVGYVDADDKQNRTSMGGYSDYVAATKASKEGRRLRFLLVEFWQLDAGTPTVLRVDNNSAITAAEGMGLTGNLKYMERRQAWLQYMVKRGKFSLRYIPTAEQPADFLTKTLHYPAFNRCSVAIGQVRLVDVGDGDNDVQQ